jgi:large subunit ribosomal protein L9
MSSGPTGKLYGAVTNQTIADELNKNGFTIERKRIEIQGLTIKHTGKYSVTIHLYESSSAAVSVIVTSQEEIETKKRKQAEEARASKKSASHTPPVAAAHSESTDEAPQEAHPYLPDAQPSES